MFLTVKTELVKSVFGGFPITLSSSPCLNLEHTIQICRGERVNILLDEHNSPFTVCFSSGM